MTVATKHLHVAWSDREGCFVAACFLCGKKVASSRSKDVARSAGLEHIGRHSCPGTQR